MGFKVYLGILLTMLVMSIVIANVRIGHTYRNMSSPLRREAANRAERLVPGAIVEWQIYGTQGNFTYMDGLNCQEEPVIKAVIDETRGRVVSMVCLPEEDKAMPMFNARNLRGMAEYWLCCLEGVRENPYQWLRDVEKGPRRYLSCWEGPNGNIGVSLSSRTGQLLNMRFEPQACTRELGQTAKY